MNKNLITTNTTDGSASAPCLKCYMTLGAARVPGGPDGSDDELYAALKEAGYDGLQGGDPALCQKYSFGNSGGGRVNAVGEVEEILKASVDAGHDCATFHVAWGIEDDTMVDALVHDILEQSSNYNMPAYIETHRATITDDMWRTVKLTERHPGIRFNGDFSHWYTGHEMVYGGFEKKLDFIQPVLDRVRFMHGRIGNPGSIQVDVGDGSGGTGFLFVDHFREMWTRSMEGFLHDAQPGDYLVFTPELLASGSYYARMFPTPDGSLREETNRWDQALVLCEIARNAWKEALIRSE